MGCLDNVQKVFKYCIKSTIKNKFALEDKIRLLPPELKVPNLCINNLIQYLLSNKHRAPIVFFKIDKAPKRLYLI